MVMWPSFMKRTAFRSRGRTNLGERGDLEPRQVDGKDAPPVRQVAREDATVVGFRAPSTEGEPQTQPGPIRASLLEGPEQRLTISAREPAAFVLDLDAHAIGARFNPERDRRTRTSELERVLQQVPNHRREDLAIGLDGDARFDRQHAQRNSPRIGIEDGGRRDLVDEGRNQQLLAVLNALCQTYFGDRSTDERAQSCEAAMEDGAGAPRHTDVSGLEDLERDDGGIGQISQFVREEAEALASTRRFRVDAELVPLARELRDRARDGLVETAVQHPKIVGAERRVQFHREFGDRLTDVAVVV